MIIDPPWWATALLEIGGGALVAFGLYNYWLWRDAKKRPPPE